MKSIDRLHRNSFRLASIFGLLMLLCVWLGAGCAGPNADYVAADKANYHDIGTDYARYVNNDATLTPDERQGKLDSLELWRMRTEAAEASPTAPGP